MANWLKDAVNLKLAGILSSAMAGIGTILSHLFYQKL
jgi:hypothetical protein